VRSRCRDILLFHPGKQHAYEVAIALQTHDRLLRFVTGFYDVPGSGSWAARGARIVSGIVGREWVAGLLAKRRHPDLDPALITSWPAAELVSRTIGVWPPVQALTRHRSGYLFANWASDRSVAAALRTRRLRPAAVYAFLGAARHTFAACRELGIRTILDVPINLSVGKILAREAAALELDIDASMSPGHMELELSGADLVIAPSAVTAQSVRAAGYSGPVTEVPFGVDFDLFRPQTGRCGTFRVAYAGRLEMRKGVHHLVEAWRHTGLPGELVLAGSAPHASFARYLRQLYGPGIRETGNLSSADLAGLLATSDVFVMPSLAEGSALVTYEALACGVPLIVTAETGSVVRDGIEGFVVPAGSPQLLAQRLRLLYDSPELRQRMAASARARAEEFSWPHYHRRLVSALDAGLDSAPTAPAS
jgi:glycosyltransferase involved in cell wall biosynthesis